MEVTQRRYMNRLIRVVRPPEPHRFPLASPRQNPTTGFRILNKDAYAYRGPHASSKSQNRRSSIFSLSSSSGYGWEFQKFAATMETDGTTRLPESDATLAEDFVHDRKIHSPEIAIDEREELNSVSEVSQNAEPFSEDSSSEIASDDDVRREDVPALTESEAPKSTVMEAQEKKVLPEELSKGVVMLECESSAEGGSCDVYVVGTAHVSRESCREVQAIIGYMKPQVVFLELCSNQVAILTPQNLQVPTMKEMVDMWKKKNMNTFGILYSWFLAKVANKLEVFPGSEFRVAFEEAMQYGGKVILGDRPVHITVRRTWGKTSLWHKAKFLYSILFQAVFLPSPEELNKMLKEMDDVDMLTLVIQDMSKAFPTLMETLVYERDLYMSSTLLRVASEHTSVVAVVGKGHLQGIKQHWKQHVDVKDLLEIPARKSTVSDMKILKFLGVAVAGAAIISGVYLAGKK
ncbi:hypothetical protein NE237_032005 [Protea cynaroides]|uniref:TraB domain-containing protein n=1 Tax=Protea cynaroides TaxID=273540 RepID=A0A9Q0L2A9_9MAGN|nr:hypothetical protein NE237_032005 [Protea cynaroides]